MNIPIVGQRANPYIVVEMIPGDAANTFNVQINTEHFPAGTPLAVQCLLQAAMFLLPHAFQAIATAAANEVAVQQRAQWNGEKK